MGGGPTEVLLNSHRIALMMQAEGGREAWEGTFRKPELDSGRTHLLTRPLRDASVVLGTVCQTRIRVPRCKVQRSRSP